MTIKYRYRHWLLPLPLIGLLAVTYWLNQPTQPEFSGADGAKRHDPDAIVERFSATRLNKLGEPHYIIAAEKMQHFPDDDSTTLDMPRLISRSGELPTIMTSAKSGILSSKGDEVFLHGDVEIIREASTKQEKLTLQTEYLHIIPDQDLMKTDRAVTINQAHNTLHAIGLEMNSKVHTIQLLSQVKSQYAHPNK